MTYEQYNTMNINKGNNKITELRTILQRENLEDFKCSQCKLELKDLQCTETSKTQKQAKLLIRNKQDYSSEFDDTVTTKS
jgi:hypothetical protein